MCDNEPCSNFQYLKPLSIESLFEVDDCTKYADTLEKAKRVRNSFFSAKTAVYNFIQDCDVIADTLQSDLSDNATEMSNIEDQYFAILNNLTSAMYTSLKQTYTNGNGMTRALINVDLAKVEDPVYDGTSLAPNDTVYAARPQKSNDLTFTHPYGKGQTTLCYIPGVTIQLNKVNKLLKVKFSQPAFHSGYNRHGQYKKEADQITTLVLAPSIYCTSSFTPWNEAAEGKTFGYCNPDGVATYATDPVNNANFNLDTGAPGGEAWTNAEGQPVTNAAGEPGVNQNNWNEFETGTKTGHVFMNVDIAMDFFEEFQNYQDNYIINDAASYGNQVLQIMNYLDRTIATMEGAHKFVVQLSKINGANPNDTKDCCPKCPSEQCNC